MTTNPEPADPFSTEELEAIVAEALADRDPHPDAQENDDDTISLVAEVEHYESFALPPLRIRMIVQWPAGHPKETYPDVANMTRRIHLAKMAVAINEKVIEKLQEQIPVNPEDQP